MSRCVDLDNHFRLKFLIVVGAVERTYTRHAPAFFSLCVGAAPLDENAQEDDEDGTRDDSNDGDIFHVFSFRLMVEIAS